MKSFLTNNLSLICNIGLLVLLFTYPIANITGINNRINKDKVSENIQVNDGRIENRKIMISKNKNEFIVKPILKKENLYQIATPLLIKK